VRSGYEEVTTTAPLVFTAHSIPIAMAESSPYVQHLEQSCRNVAEAVGCTDWSLAYQSRSGPPTQPWLEPDILERLRELHEAGAKEVVVCPIGFCSDHMEVLYDLDTEAAALCKELQMKMVRTGTAGSHPVFIDMIRRQILEGSTTPILEHCSAGCCPAPQRTSSATAPSRRST
jgi:ferrochelatase